MSVPFVSPTAALTCQAPVSDNGRRPGGVGPDIGKCRHPTVFWPLKIIARPHAQDFKSASELLKADVRFTPNLLPKVDIG